MPTINIIDYIFALLIGLVYLGLGVFALRRRLVPGATALSIIMFAAAGYAVPYIFELASPNLPTAQFWYNLSLPGASILGPAWLVFALQYTLQEEILTKRRTLLLGLIPLITCLAAWSNPLHGLYGSNFQFNPQDPWPVLKWNFGFFYWLNFAYAYVLTLMGVAILARTALHRFRLFTNQSLLLLAGIFLPILVNVLFVLGYTPIPNLDLAPFLFLFTGLTWSLAIFRFQLLDIVPIAQERVFGTMPVGMIVLNHKGQVVNINPAAVKMVALPQLEIIGKELPQALGILFSDKLFKDAPEELYKEVGLGEGNKRVYLDLQLTNLFDGRRNLIGALILMQDITLRKQAIEAEREQRLLAEVLRDTAADMTRTTKFEDVLDHILINLGKIVPHDAAHLVIFNQTSPAISRCRWQGAYPASPGMEDQSAPSKHVWNCSPQLFERMRSSSMPCLLLENDIQASCRTCLGREWVASSIGMPLHIRGQLAGMAVLDSKHPDNFSESHIERLGIFASQAAVAIENARLYEELEERAIRDELTGAFNRRGLLERAQMELKRARRYRHPLGVIMFDMDNLKGLNDFYGHSAGDIVLRTTIRKCFATIREIDILGRYGGDEFVVLLPESTREIVCQVGERLRSSVEDLTVHIREEQVPITISVGTTFDPTGEFDMDVLFQNADHALYAAKQAGRNLVRSYP